MTRIFHQRIANYLFHLIWSKNGALLPLHILLNLHDVVHTLKVIIEIKIDFVTIHRDAVHMLD